MRQRRRAHIFGAQCLPLIAGQVVCLRCGLVRRIGDWPTGRRRKCSPGLTYAYLGDGATGQHRRSDDRVFLRSHGHAGYWQARKRASS